MKTIASFTIDHIRLLPGLYVSRKDEVGGNRLTTFDVRLTAPNREPVLSTGAIHAIEHIGATYLRRDSGLASQTIYWGPMGCRTGFYAIFSGDLTPQDIVDVDDPPLPGSLRSYRPDSRSIAGGMRQLFRYGSSCRARDQPQVPGDSDTSGYRAQQLSSLK